MPLPKEILDEMLERHLREHEEANRDARLSTIRTALECLAWSALGIVCIGWSLHTTDPDYGRIAFYAGIGFGNGGILFSLADWYRRAARRGD